MKNVRRLAVAAAFTAVILAPFSPGDGWGETAFSIGFFQNANNPALQSGNMYITNPGISGGGLCADIYVFDRFGQLQECCGCPVREDGLLTLSINDDLTSNPITPIQLSKGIFKIISSSGYPNCDPGYPMPTPALVGFNDWVQFGDIKGESTDKDHKDWVMVTLSSAEQTRLTRSCSIIRANGSGYGVCSCGKGQ
ncbi:MAG TPA: hypothetical protein VLS90_03330 [Thermodesulfobacteriota bacterium]|nr:hypothetical protein [Thermodesulfobacteriota bacterium]